MRLTEICPALTASTTIRMARTTTAALSIMMLCPECVSVMCAAPGTIGREMKPPWVDAGLRELVGISLIAAGGCGLALSQGDFLFAAIFAAACAVTIIEAIWRSR